MGLTIHYSAHLRQMEDLPTLVKEVADICTSLNWEYQIIDAAPIAVPAAAMPLEPGETDPKLITLKGIIFGPPERENVLLTFTNSGRTSSYIHLKGAEKSAKFDVDFRKDLAEHMPEEAKKFETIPTLIYTMHTKTQYGGMDMHIAIVKLLKYLEEKYFFPMYVSDEGNYWDTMDEKILQEHFDENWKMIGALKNALTKENWTITHSPMTIKMENILKGKSK